MVYLLVFLPCFCLERTSSIVLIEIILPFPLFWGEGLQGERMSARIRNSYTSVIDRQRDYILSGGSREPVKRIALLNNLLAVIRKREGEILTALKIDLGKSEVEAYTSEILMVVKEIQFARKKLKKWVRPRRVKTPLFHYPGKSWILSEPLGSVLIIAPWNYPFQLMMAPLVAAIAAGNSAVLKPSEVAPATAKVIKKIISETFDPQEVVVVAGGVAKTTELLKNKFDMIFYTGSSAVGRIVMRAAAKNLTPVILELGGKSPCIIDHTADLAVAARRVVWGKFLNAGQTCVAPDYLYVEESGRERFLIEMKKTLVKFYGEDPEKSPYYGRIINTRHCERLIRMIPKQVSIGGRHNLRKKYIEPTIVEGVTWKSPLMREEIFGPILPLFSFSDLEEVIKAVVRGAKPLAFYLFSRDKRVVKRLLREVPCGGVCINDTVRHIVSEYLPFGGVGESGMGNYHGYAGFRAFSHEKSVMRRSFRMDSSFVYPPYKIALSWLKKLLRIF